LCAILASAQRPGFAPASRYIDEISDQLADFIATNPPRFGVNWMSSMDVGIRAANIALTVALLAGAGMTLPPAVNEIVAGALNDHARHVVDHLEYSESGRSNHYLANLGGVMWSSWLLTGVDANQRLVFAIAELLSEADNQFLHDGGNYEGSTSYHRLSAEIAIFALALIASLDATAIAQMERSLPPRRPWRAVFPKLPLPRYAAAQEGRAIVPPGLLRKIVGAARLASAIQGSDSTIVQIGDTDSGRFFKMHPTALPPGFGGAGTEFVENNLDHRGLISAAAALFGADPQGKMLDAVLVHRLIKPSGPLVAPAPGSPLADFGDVDALIARWKALPEASRRLRRISLGQTVPPESWTRAAFPDFGLYVFRYRDLLISLRCCGAPPEAAPRGHRHDDNLGIEYRLNGHECRDPGSFVYTPSVKHRNQYRAASAHDVPRARGQQFARSGSALFDIDEIAYARCLLWRPDGIAGEVAYGRGTVLRIVQVTSEELLIFDCVQPPAELGEHHAALPVSKGYGRI
jgi:Heparinase II/III N-terminus/Heparinase II/III-like protein